MKSPAIAGPSRLAGTVVDTTMSPKLAPAGVLTGLVVPLNVIVVVPLILLKLTTFVPDILKTPVVENVTGSALAVPSLIEKIATATTLNAKSFNRRRRLFIFFSLYPVKRFSERDSFVIGQRAKLPNCCKFFTRFACREQEKTKESPASAGLALLSFLDRGLLAVTTEGL